MPLEHFDNDQGEAIVGFEPHASGWHTVLTMRGEPVILFGNPCGTCGFTFGRVGSPTHRVTDKEAVELLGDLRDVPPETVLRRLARILPRGPYRPCVLETRVRFAVPGSREDFFSDEAVRLFGRPRHVQEPKAPPPAYYRLTPEHVIHRSNFGFFEALLTGVVMPLHDPAGLSRERIDHWKLQFQGGRPPTVFALSVLDVQSPATDQPGSDPAYPYAEQMLLTNFLLDGHHRIQAAAELDSVVRVLAMVHLESCRVPKGFDFTMVLERLRFARW